MIRVSNLIKSANGTRILRDVSFEVATAVALEAVREGIASFAEDSIEGAVREAMWKPLYPRFEPR